MNDFSGKKNLNREEAIKACRQLSDRLADPNRLPLERQANLILAQMLHMQIRELGLMENPDVQDFLQILYTSRRRITVKRFPQDFV